MTLFWNELHWYQFCAEASLFQSDYIPSDSPPTASPPCLASGLHQPGVLLPAWTLLLLYKHPDQMSQGSFRAERQPLSLLCFPACLTPLLFLFPSSPLPLSYWPSGDAMAQVFSELFSLPGEEHVQSSLDESVLCCDLSVSGVEHGIVKQLWGQGPAPYYTQGTGWHYCKAEVFSYCSLYLKFCSWFCKVLSRYK